MNSPAAFVNLVIRRSTVGISLFILAIRKPNGSRYEGASLLIGATSARRDSGGRVN